MLKEDKKRTLYPPIEPNHAGFIDAGGVHERGVTTAAVRGHRDVARDRQFVKGDIRIFGAGHKSRRTTDGDCLLVG